MTIGRGARILLSAIAVLLGTSASVAAQTDDEIFPQFQWNFSTPGARANAMGRAFIGMADDATATISNPAGLVNLTRPQVDMEYKNTNLKVNRLADVDSLISTAHNPTTFKKDINSLSFLSVSTPLGKRLAVGFTRHEFLNYQEEFHLAPRAYLNSPFNSAFFPVSGSADFKGANYGFTVSAALSQKVLAGLTVSINQLSAKAIGTRTNMIFGRNFPPGGTDRSNLFETSIIVNQTIIDESGTAGSVGFGLLFKASEKLSVGLNVAQGPKFKVEEDLLANDGFINGCFQAANCTGGTNLALHGFSDFPRTVHINVPNRIGFGLAARPNPKFLFAFDVVNVRYSSLTDNFTVIFGDPISNGTEYKIDNVVETHLGAEYSMSLGNTPTFLRAGVYTNPNHSVKFTDAVNAAIPVNDLKDFNAGEEATYNTLPRKTETKGTVGAGFAFGQRMQLDLAYVFGKEFVASTAVRFK